jgi:hypothetical protein
VQQVGDPRVGVVVGAGDLDAEPGHEDRLELQARARDRRQRLAAELDRLRGVERALVEAGRRVQQVVGQQPALADAARELDVRLDHAGQRRGVELVDPPADGIGSSGHGPGHEALPAGPRDGTRLTGSNDS